MKNYIKIGALSVISALTLSSCGEDYLEKYPSQYISDKQFGKAAKDRPSLLKASLQGIYKTIYSTQTGGTPGSNEDFGQKGYDLVLDLLSQDMALSQNTYGRYLRISNFDATQDFTNLNNYRPWRYYYRIIRATNQLLSAVVNEDGTYPQDDETKANVGQALALRGQCYFMLLNIYAKEINSQDKVLPLYNDVTLESKQAVENSKILDSAIKDLETAVQFLPNFNRKSKNEVNLDVAQVLLAYAYGMKGENEKAYQQVKAVLDRGNYPILQKDMVAYNKATQKGNGFNDVNSTNWIWGQDITLDDGLNLTSWWGQMDYFSYSYQAYGDRKSIDKGLFDKIKADDVRKNWFAQDDKDYTYLMPINKFYDPNRKYGGQRTITTDYVYMRVEEAYLLAAEFAAKTNKEDEAKKYLKALLSKRVDDSSYVDTLSGDALLNEILLQTRIEMWGEGKSYLLMKRNKTTVTRGSNHLTFVGESYKYNDEKLTLRIPQNVIENNPYY